KKGEKVVTKKPTKPGKKDSRIEDDILATIVLADFGRYLASVGHSKASDIFSADLKHLRMKCQTDSKAANCGVFATYGNRLRVKYAAKIMISDSNIHLKKVFGLLNVKQGNLRE
nr:hypothetical protein [Tanacetum cinerariifolium]